MFDNFYIQNDTFNYLHNAFDEKALFSLENYMTNKRLKVVSLLDVYEFLSQTDQSNIIEDLAKWWVDNRDSICEKKYLYWHNNRQLYLDIDSFYGSIIDMFLDKVKENVYPYALKIQMEPYYLIDVVICVGNAKDLLTFYNKRYDDVEVFF